MPDDFKPPDSPELLGPIVHPRYEGLLTFVRVPHREGPAGIDIGCPFGRNTQTT